MAVFSNYFTENELEDAGLPEVDVESIVDDETIESAWEESSIETAARIVAESTINYNRIMEACAIMELNFLEENGREFIYEADGTGFFEKAKEFFRNLWAKIQSLFKKAIAQFNSWFASDKEFVRKYKKDLYESINTNGSFSDKDVDMFPYVYLKSENTISAPAKAAEKAEEGSTVAAIKKALASGKADQLKELIEKEYTNDKMTEAIEEYRGEFVADLASTCGVNYSASGLSSSEFSKDLAEVLQGGESSKVSKSLSSVISEAMSFLEASDKIKKGINDAMKELKRAFDKEIRDVETLQKEYQKLVTAGKDEENKVAGHGHTLCAKTISLMKDMKTANTTAQGVMLNTLKACSRQSKAICVKALTYKKPKNESAAFEEGATGLLGSIQLV